MAKPTRKKPRRTGARTPGRASARPPAAPSRRGKTPPPQGAPDPAAAAARLAEPMLKRPYFVMLREIVAPDRLRAHVADHLRWAIALEEAGKIFVSGPFVGDDGKPQGGMTVFRVDTRAAAARLAMTDPLVRAGAVLPHIHRWILMEGSVAAEIRFSNQSVRFDDV